ncbi:MAG: extracellular solute-binding protein [Pseudomonadota bacterium]
MTHRSPWTRRQFVGTAAATGALAAAGTALAPGKAFAQSSPIEINHWSWLTASDGEVWGKMIDSFNEAHKDKGVQIKMEVIPYEQYTTKVLAAAATGQAPDFGWGTAGLGANFAKQGVTVPLDKLAGEAGLDLADFTEPSLKASRYPQYDNQLFMVPMDLMSLQPEINLDHVAEAGLSIPDAPAGGPQTDAELLEWAEKMTKRDGDKVVRSGIMMTGSGVQPTVTWGIVAEQMGFRRASDDLKTAAINPDAGKKAMEWVLALFDQYKVSTRDVTDRYKAFGTGEGSIFWTGPWTLSGYVDQGLNFATTLFPQIGDERLTYFEMGGLELYTQQDAGRQLATMEAVKWLSDNSFPWTTVGRGVTPRISILDRPDYKTAGHPWSVRGAFVEGMEFATIGEVPVTEAPDFTIYSGGNFLAKTLEGVWVGQTSIDEAMEKIEEQWQEDLDKG